MFDSHNVMKPFIPQLDTIALVHFRFNQKLLAGVENVMHVQKKLLEHAGRKAWFLVGETDLATDCVVYEPIRMYGSQLGWEEWQQPSIDGRMVKCITAALGELTQDSAVIFHNTTNAAVYNPPFGIAAAKIVSQSIRGERPPAVLWAHDAPASPLQLRRLLPDEEEARIAVISGVTRDKIQRAIASMRRQGLAVPHYDLRIIPNAIDAQFFESTIQTPQTLADLAPQFFTFAQEHGLPQNYDKVQGILFSEHLDHFKLLLPARIIHNKGIKEAIGVAEAYADIYKQQVVLTVTNQPELDMQKNRDYWEEIKTLYRSVKSSKVEIILLGGVDWNYMKWLYQASDLLLAPFQNEGFGLPPIEAACCELASAISTDPALKETTGENALVMDYNLWRKPRDVARHIHAYMSSQRKALHLKKLKEKAMSEYSPQTVMQQTLDVLDFSSCASASDASCVSESVPFPSSPPHF
jgi:glycosyltransferase involved in cell wall biosynthesis